MTAEPGARLRDRPALVGLTVGLAGVEAAVVARLGPFTGLALAPQVSAPTPFAAFHDLRWVLVYTPSWVAVVVAVGAMLALRTAVTAAIVVSAWPSSVARPARGQLLRRAFVATVVVALLLVPWAALDFATAVFSLSWTWIVAVPVVVMIGAVVHGAAVNDAWWRLWPRAATIGAVLATFAALTVLGAVIAIGPALVRAPAVVAAGVVNAWCWLRVTHAVAGRVPERTGPPFAAVALASVLVLVLGGAAAGFAIAVAVEGGRGPVPRVAAGATGPPVLVVRGFNSKWDGVTRRWIRGSFRLERFSYAGVRPSGAPRAYDRDATHASVRALARRMRTQVDALASRTGEPVGIVAESEGALVALAYLLGTPGAPVRSIVVLSPLPEPGRVFYPAPGHAGWGIAAGAALSGVAAVVNGLGPVSVKADTPLFRSIVEQAPLFQGLLQCRAPGVRELVVLPVDTGVAAPAPASIRVPHVARPAFHGGLLGDESAARLTRRVLRGAPVSTDSPWSSVERVTQALASPWQVPNLTRSLVPGWRHQPDPDDCRSVRRGLRAYLGRPPST